MFCRPTSLCTKGTCLERPLSSSPVPPKPPRPPGAPPRRVTGRRTPYQVTVLPLRLGEANPTPGFLRPENRDSPDSRKPHNPGPTAAAAAEGLGEASGGSTLVASDLAADSGRSSLASAESTLYQRCKKVPTCKQCWCKKNPILGKIIAKFYAVLSRL